MPEAALVRFARAPDGAVVPDLAAKLPGRGVWVKAERAALDQAVKRNVFARGFKEPAQPPPDLSARVEAGLAQRALSTLGLGRKAGALAFGQAKVEEAIRKAPIFGMVEASDGGEDGRERLYKLCLSRWGAAPFLVGCFTAEELGVALGRPHVVHACWLQERMARLWAEEIRRLAGFRALVPASWRSDLAQTRGPPRDEGVDDA